MQFGDYIALVGQICVVPDQCSSDYMDWFYMILHSFMTPTQPGDPPRVPPVQEYDIFFEPDMHQQSVATAAPDEVDVDVHRAGHVVVIYFIWYFVFVCCFILYFITNNCYIFFTY